MMQTSIRKFAEEIGFDIANTDDETQAKLVNGFCRGLHNSMRSCEREQQICYIAQRLDNNAYDILRAIVEFCELKEERESRNHKQEEQK